MAKVQHYCRRELCAKPFEYTKTGGRHYYCSTACREKDWWEGHRSRHNKNSRKAQKRWRKNWTPEQKEANKKYQANYREAHRELARLTAADYRRVAREEATA